MLRRRHRTRGGAPTYRTDGPNHRFETAARGLPKGTSRPVPRKPPEPIGPGALAKLITLANRSIRNKDTHAWSRLAAPGRRGIRRRGHMPGGGRPANTRKDATSSTRNGERPSPWDMRPSRRGPLWQVTAGQTTRTRAHSSLPLALPCHGPTKGYKRTPR
jgi:hypothetical protein